MVRATLGMRCCFVGCIVALLITENTPLSAAEFFAAPHGKSEAAGTRVDPWDLASALLRTDRIRPGDTLWLRGGTYRGSFLCRLSGDAERPVTIRQAPGERATIDLTSTDGRNPLFRIEGDRAIFRDFEVTCSDPRRHTKQRGSWPTDIQRGSVDCRAAHVKLINMIIHDTGGGVDFWSEGEGGEIYGCLIYYNGWLGPDRGHGHGIYTQNERGIKRIVDNVIFSQFGYGIHAYGSEKAHLNNFHIEGNIVFNSGALTSPTSRTTAILVGGGCVARGVIVANNYTWADHDTTTLRLGYPWGPANEDALVRDNYLVGMVALKEFPKFDFTGNTVTGNDSLVEVYMAPEQDTAADRWNRNEYVRRGSRYAAFSVLRGKERSGGSFARWQQETGWDAASRYLEGQPNGVRVFVRPNQYEPGRAHVAVYNWNEQPEVEVDLSDVLTRGQRYRVLNAEAPFGEPLVKGTYNGRPVHLPMRPTPVARPVGLENDYSAATRPHFGAFLVLPDP